MKRKLIKFIKKNFFQLIGISFSFWLVFSPGAEQSFSKPVTEQSYSTVVATKSIGIGGAQNGEPTPLSTLPGPQKGPKKAEIPVTISPVRSGSESRPNQVRFKYPASGGNGGGNGGGNDPRSYLNDTGEWVCPSLSSDTIISDPEFWRKLSKGEKTSSIEEEICSIEDDVEDVEDVDDDDIPELKERRLSPEEKRGESPRRRLLAGSAPTASLDVAVMEQYDYTTRRLPLFKYRSYDGRKLTMGQNATKKIAYAHQTDLGIFNLPDRIVCPKQPDLTKFQRLDCWAMTDSARDDVVAKIFELTTTSDPFHKVLKGPMPHQPNRDCYIYTNILTGQTAYFHLNGRLWSADRLGTYQFTNMVGSPNYIVNPPVKYENSYTYWLNRNKK